MKKKKRFQFRIKKSFNLFSKLNKGFLVEKMSKINFVPVVDIFFFLAQNLSGVIFFYVTSKKRKT